MESSEFIMSLLIDLSIFVLIAIIYIQQSNKNIKTDKELRVLNVGYSCVSLELWKIKNPAKFKIGETVVGYLITSIDIGANYPNIGYKYVYQIFKDGKMHGIDEIELSIEQMQFDHQKQNDNKHSI